MMKEKLKLNRSSIEILLDSCMYSLAIHILFLVWIYKFFIAEWDFSYKVVMTLILY